MKNLYALIFCIFSFAVHLNAQILTTSELPIIIIETGNQAIPDEPKINATMGIIDNGVGQLNHINDAFNHYNGRIGIETRGNSTQDFEKKTYSIETRTAMNEDTSVSLLGTAKEEDWILHAMVIDKTQLRIPMSFYLFREMGHYASDWRFVELVIDGDYRGLYLLCEKIKRDKNRVDIAKLTGEDVVGDEVTGGYILRLDWVDEESEGFDSKYDAQSEQRLFYQWYYPRARDILPEQAAYIQSFMDNFEDAVFSDDYFNSIGGRYTDYIDMQSFADFLLINELSKNADGYKLSSYLHKEKDSNGGKLNAGPIWDFDQTYGVSLVCSNNDYTGWTFLQNQENCEDLESMPMWWQAMVKDSVFSDYLKSRWSELRAGLLEESNVMSWIDDQANRIQPAVDRNFERWEGFIGEAIWIEPEPIPQTYAAEVATMKDWISNRLAWMDSQMSRIDNISSDGLTKLDVFPNPATDFISLRGNNGDEARLFNTSGQLVYEAEITSDNFEINIANFQSGFYFLHVISELTMFEVEKIVILER